jgi:hypothetical protein
MSQFKVIEPVKFNATTAAYTNATNLDPNWSAGSYAQNAYVTHWVVRTKGYAKGISQPRRFKSMVAANTAVPGTDSSKWLDAGPANTVAMFDTWSSVATTKTGTLELDILPGDLVTSIGFVGLKGDRIRVTVMDGPTAVWQQEENLLDSNVLNLFDYFTAPFEQRTRQAFFGLPSYASNFIRVEVFGAQTAIERVVFGRLHEIGLGPQYGATAGLIDYSMKEVDPEFGDVEEFVERDASDEGSYVLEVDKARLNTVSRLLRKLRATPTLWIASDDEAYAELFTIFGWCRDFRFTVPYPLSALLDLEIEGLAS